MDLSNLSDNDLAALQSGDLTKLSDVGLNALSDAHKYGSGIPYDAVNGQVVPSASPEAQAAASPLSGIPSYQQFAAGYGKAGYDLARGVGQPLGLVSRQDIANSRALDAPLMASTAGRIGNFTGTALDLAPTAFIPGANTLLGAGAIGAGIGALQPSVSTGETLSNTGWGTALAPASILGGRLLGTAYQGAKGLIAPFFQSGQEGIAARTLQSFAGGQQAATDAAEMIAKAPAPIPGVLPTTAELSQNAGLSQLERVVRNNPEYLNQITTRLQSNRQAMTGAVSGIAGTDIDRDAAEALRTKLTAPLYKAAGNAAIVPDETLTNLLQRPSLSSAWGRASQLAAERGEPLVEGQDIPAKTVSTPTFTDFGSPYSTTTTPAQSATYSGKAIQYLKMSLNDMVNTGFQQGMGSHEIGALRGTLGELNDWIGNNVPSLKAADQLFQMTSAPINQMDVGTALSQKLQPALSDFGGVSRLNANAYANALRNGDQLAQKVTGWKGATLAGTLSSDQMNTVTSIAKQLANRANADDLGRATGSNTAQNLISQNMLRQMLGPLGLPNGWGERVAQSSLAQTLTRPLQWAGQIGQDRVMGKLSQAVLDPDYARGLLQQGVSTAPSGWNQLPAGWTQAPRFLPAPALAYSQQQ